MVLGFLKKKTKKFLKKGKEMVEGVKTLYNTFNGIRPCMYSGLVEKPMPLLLFNWTFPSLKEGFERTPWGQIETNMGTYQDSAYQTNCSSKFRGSAYHADGGNSKREFHRFFVAKVKVKLPYGAMWGWREEEDMLKQLKDAEKYHFDTQSTHEAMQKLIALTVNERKNGFPYENYSKWMPWKKSGIIAGQEIFVLVPAEDLNYFKKEKVSFHEDQKNLRPGLINGRWDDLDDRSGRIAITESMTKKVVGWKNLKMHSSPGLARKRNVQCAQSFKMDNVGEDAYNKGRLYKYKKKCSKKKTIEDNKQVQLDIQARIKMRVHPDYTNTTEIKFVKVMRGELHLGYKVEDKFRHIVSDDIKDPYETIVEEKNPKNLKEVEREVDQDSLEDLVEGKKEIIENMGYDEWGCPDGNTGCSPHSLPPMALEKEYDDTTDKKPIGKVNPALFNKPRAMEINPEGVKKKLMEDDPPFKGLPAEALRAAYLGRDCKTDADCTEWNRDNGLMCHSHADICIDKTDKSYDDDTNFDSNDVVKMLTGKPAHTGKTIKRKCNTIKYKTNCKKDKRCWYNNRKKRCRTKKRRVKKKFFKK